MKYVCTFEHPKTHQRRQVIVDVPPSEIAEHPELVRQAYALRRAYREVPRGFLHDQVEHLRLH
jgi:hypothetical protein